MAQDSTKAPKKGALKTHPRASIPNHSIGAPVSSRYEYIHQNPQINSLTGIATNQKRGALMNTRRNSLFVQTDEIKVEFKNFTTHNYISDQIT